jgi:hypothetical protein
MGLVDPHEIEATNLDRRWVKPDPHDIWTQSFSTSIDMICELELALKI